MARRRLALALTLVLAALAAPAEAFRAEVERYFRALEWVCLTGITPEMHRLHAEAAAAVEAARYGGGRDNNFWGVKTPEHAWLQCFQSPGDFQ